jgi:hypothetical protein
MRTSDIVSFPTPFHKPSSFYGGQMLENRDEEMITVRRTRRDVLKRKERWIFFINGAAPNYPDKVVELQSRSE